MQTLTNQAKKLVYVVSDIMFRYLTFSCSSFTLQYVVYHNSLVFLNKI